MRETFDPKTVTYLEKSGAFKKYQRVLP